MGGGEPRFHGVARDDRERFAGCSILNTIGGEDRGSTDCEREDRQRDRAGYTSPRENQRSEAKQSDPKRHRGRNRALASSGTGSLFAAAAGGNTNTPHW